MSLVRGAIEGGVGRLHLSRPEKRNAINEELAEEAISAIRGFVAADVAIGVLTAEAPVFCSGVDLNAARGGDARALDLELLDELTTAPILWVCGVEGPVIAAGAALVAACPIVIASDEAWVSLPERTLGVFPARVTAYLEASIGLRQSFKLGITGSRITAPDAAAIGLFTEVVSPQLVTETIDRWLAELADQQRAFVDAAGASWRSQFKLAHSREVRAAAEAVLSSNRDALNRSKRN